MAVEFDGTLFAKSNINALKRYFMFIIMGFIDMNNKNDKALGAIKSLDPIPNEEIEESMYGILEEYSLFNIKENFDLSLKEYMSLHIIDREFLLNSSKKISKKKTKLLEDLGLTNEENLHNN